MDTDVSMYVHELRKQLNRCSQIESIEIEKATRTNRTPSIRIEIFLLSWDLNHNYWSVIEKFSFPWWFSFSHQTHLGCFYSINSIGDLKSHPTKSIDIEFDWFERHIPSGHFLLIKFNFNNSFAWRKKRRSWRFVRFAQHQFETRQIKETEQQINETSLQATFQRNKFDV